MVAGIAISSSISGSKVHLVMPIEIKSGLLKKYPENDSLSSTDISSANLVYQASPVIQYSCNCVCRFLEINRWLKFTTWLGKIFVFSTGKYSDDESMSFCQTKKFPTSILSLTSLLKNSNA